LAGRFLLNCLELIEIQGLQDWNPLEELSIEDCRCVQSIHNLSNSHKLKELSLYSCTSLELSFHSCYMTSISLSKFTTREKSIGRTFSQIVKAEPFSFACEAFQSIIPCSEYLQRVVLTECPELIQTVGLKEIGIICFLLSFSRQNRKWNHWIHCQLNSTSLKKGYPVYQINWAAECSGWYDFRGKSKSNAILFIVVVIKMSTQVSLSNDLHIHSPLRSEMNRRLLVRF